MNHSLHPRPVSLLLVALATVGLLGWLQAMPITLLYAAVSPLATPWPTLVVTYQPVLPTITPALAPNATAARVNFVFHSPLPTPMPLPDLIPPQTALRLTGEPGNGQWYRSPVTVAFDIADNLGAGVTAYQLDNAPTWREREYYYPPLTIGDDGVHTLAYQSIDRLHNRETAQTAQIRIDRTPPDTAAPVMAGNQLPNGWYNSPVQVTLGGSDALSGLAGFAQQIAAGIWSPQPAVFTLATTGPHAFTWRAVDNAGNVSAAQQTTVQVDVTPPTTTYSLDAVLVNGWYSRPVTVTLSAVDLGAGLFQTQYRRNGEPSWQSYGAPFAVTQPGVQVVNYQSTDRALNVENPQTLILPLDLAPPTLDVAVSRPPATGNWYSGQLTVTAQATDGQAGLASLEYALDGGGWQPYSAPLPFASGTLHTLRLRATDRVGHQAVSTLLQLGIDTQPPTTTVQLSQSPNASGWFSAPVTLACPVLTARPAFCTPNIG